MVPFPRAPCVSVISLGSRLNKAGDLFIADTGNYRVRKLSNGMVSTVAGRSHFEGDGGPAVHALIHKPHYTAVDSTGNLYFTDEANARIRKVAPGGTITTVVGSGNWGSVPAGVAALNADIGAAGPITVDSKGTLYFAANDDPASSTSSPLRKLGADGRVATVVGAGLTSVYALAADAAGNVFIISGVQIVKLSPDGRQTVVAGGTGYGSRLSDRPRSSPASSHRARHRSRWLLFFAETGWLRKLSPDGKVTLIAGNGKQDFFVEDARAVDSPLPEVLSIAAEKNGNVYLLTRYSGVILVGADGRLTKFQEEWAYDGGSLAATTSGTLFVADTRADRIYSVGPNRPARFEILGGDRQIAHAGSLMPKPLQVRLVGSPAPLSSTFLSISASPPPTGLPLSTH